MHRAFKPPRRQPREPSVVCLSSNSSEAEATPAKKSVPRPKRQKKHSSPQPAGPSTSASPLSPRNEERYTAPATRNGKKVASASTGRGRNGGEITAGRRETRTRKLEEEKLRAKPPAKRTWHSSSEKSEADDSSPERPPLRHSGRAAKPVLKRPTSSNIRSTSRETFATDYTTTTYTTKSTKSPSPSPVRRQSSRTTTTTTTTASTTTQQPKPSKAARVKPSTAGATGRMCLSSRVPDDDVTGTGSSSTAAASTSAMPAMPPRCALCDRTDTDKIRYFRMDSQGDLHAHYLCMFTASNLHQTGDPRAKNQTDEICGFLCANVKKERYRARQLTCKYCKKKGAAVGCAIKKCNASYHYPCGVENSCYFQFTGSFESYCPTHIPKGRIPRPKDMSTVKKDCTICLESPDLKDKVNTVITPCCSCALHRECLAGLAVNAGKHYIKCPSCNIVDNFKAFCEQVGVHVPNADATWLADEEAERAREDQEEGEDVQCAAQEGCLCPNGLTFDEDVPGRDWNIERCTMGCGTLMHAACMKHVGKKGSDRRNYCYPCFELEIKISKQLGRNLTSRHGDREKEETPGSPEIQERPQRARVVAAGRVLVHHEIRGSHNAARPRDEALPKKSLCPMERYLSESPKLDPEGAEHLQFRPQSIRDVSHNRASKLVANLALLDICKANPTLGCSTAAVNNQPASSLYELDAQKALVNAVFAAKKAAIVGRTAGATNMSATSLLQLPLRTIHPGVDSLSTFNDG
ncbi:putative G2/M phase-specific E3 ubiquitin-protein ligase [Hypsibius exemplaris]|uniref:G2/M phase-specific E3 ubiquitin-protein ligase n=1 Tax=Hypsibius exemplaris TaxID=2072580 RepID=A0A1W0WR53_HYPEX|nr:putative G2/M phase-specific E3 ubiquitin-protein ligase [Hypsibius exemplaris]